MRFLPSPGHADREICTNFEKTSKHPRHIRGYTESRDRDGSYSNWTTAAILIHKRVCFRIFHSPRNSGSVATRYAVSVIKSEAGSWVRLPMEYRMTKEWVFSTASLSPALVLQTNELDDYAEPYCTPAAYRTVLYGFTLPERGRNKPRPCKDPWSCGYP